ncbi:GAF domain-containing protein [Halobaculum lipolyticum]|uniref:GAF domain-containing protein n=1 Tax=Halobaculum lipolyticum TaxID=3032001 RepID=A0ABD5W5R0_9EURY|nr:GAF domain-containing protein [Halobaculum sp. DT31]
MTTESLSPALAETLAVFDGSGTPLTTPEVTDDLDVGRRSTYNRLRKLADRDRVETKKVGANARVWWRPRPQGADDPALAATAAPDPRTDADGSEAPDRDGEWLDPVRLGRLLDAVRDGVFVLDGRDRYEWVNETYASMCGLDRSAIVGEHVSAAIDDDETVDRIERSWGPLAAGERRFDRLETAVSNPDGHEWTAEVRVTSVGTGDGVDRFGVVRDVTDRRDRERALSRANTQLETLIDSIPDGTVTLVDTSLRYVRVGGTTAESIDVSKAELEGRPVESVLPEPVADQLIPAYEAALAGTATDIELTIGDRIYESHYAPIRDDDGTVTAAFGVAHDVTEREAATRALRRQLDRQETVAELTRRAFDGDDPDELTELLVDGLADTLPVSRCGVFVADADGGVSLRYGTGWADEDGDAAAPADRRYAERAIASGEPLRVGDPETPSGFCVPVRPGNTTWGTVAVFGDDPGTIDERDATFVDSVATLLAVAIDRHRRETAAEARREREAAINDLHDAVFDVTTAVIGRSTRGEIERAVCERLVESAAYEFAWIGEVDEAADTLSLRAEAGVEGYLDGVTLSVAPDADPHGGPTADAVRTGEPQFTDDALTDPRHEPVRDRVHRYGFRSSAAIPVTHEGTIYGVLNVYAERADAFDSRERAVIAQLGEIVGHAIAATERKRALLSDELVELTFRIDDVFRAVDTEVEPEGTFSWDHMVPLDDGDFLVYGTATPDAMPFLRDLEAHNPEWDSITVRSSGPPVRYELKAIDLPVFTAIASRGGYIDRAVVDGGDLRLTLCFSPTVDIPGLIETFQDNYPHTDLRRRRQITRSYEDAVRIRRRMAGDLTDRQRTALEAAYHAGFFEWPRDASGEEVAAAMGIAPPTFHQHLRRAERKVFDAVLATPVERAE